MTAGTLPPFIGIRIKPLSRELHARSLRTLDIFVTTLVKTAEAPARRTSPSPLPKVDDAAHVTARRASAALRSSGKLRLRARRDSARADDRDAAVDPRRRTARRAAARSSRPDDGRVRGAHFGVYDYTALCGITAAWQHLRHPSCDFARAHDAGLAGADRREAVRRLEQRPADCRRTSSPRGSTHFDDVTHSLVNGFYQGWDLHPAHLPTRYAAVYAFYLVGVSRSDGSLEQLFHQGREGRRGVR